MPNGQSNRPKIAFFSENADNLEFAIPPMRKQAFSRSGAPKIDENRARTASESTLDDIFRQKRPQQASWSAPRAFRSPPGTPKEAPRGPKGAPKPPPGHPTVLILWVATPFPLGVLAMFINRMVVFPWEGLQFPGLRQTLDLQCPNRASL